MQLLKFYERKNRLPAQSYECIQQFTFGRHEYEGRIKVALSKKIILLPALCES